MYMLGFCSLAKDAFNRNQVSVKNEQNRLLIMEKHNIMNHVDIYI